MDDARRLKIAVDFIVAGLYEKQKKKGKKPYAFSSCFMKGIHIFQNLRLKYNPKEFDFTRLHEQAFIEDYIFHPVSEWFCGWENVEKLDLNHQAFYHLDVLAEDIGYQDFYLTNTFEDYVQHIKLDEGYARDIIGENEQKIVYEYLIQLKQDEYADLRKFFIQHPIASLEQIQEKKILYLNSEMAQKAIGNAYEEIKENCYICPNCGWTIKKHKNSLRCQSYFCERKSYFKTELEPIFANSGQYRLKRGMMKYICIPGRLELEIEEYCKRKKLKTQLWPEMDRYDVEISFPNGDVWEIDAKAVKNPYILREFIKNQGGFPIGDYQKGFFVIPDQYVRERKDYLAIINSQLNKIGDKKISCVSIHDLKREIRKRI